MLNGVLLVDKPTDFTSHDVVAKLRGILKMRKIGHAGTLDPMATGVLVVLLGNATVASDYLAADFKEYVARFKLGIVTDTQDITGNILAHEDVKCCKTQVEQAVKSFKGDYDQLPPMYSAIQVDGKRLYDLARKGIEVERKTRPIEISEIELTCGKTMENWQELCENEYEIRVLCSKGTYVRTICHDIGQKIGCGATMTALRRVKSGSYDIKNAVTLEEIQSSQDRQSLVLPLHTAFEKYPRVVLNEDGCKRASNGAFLQDFHLMQGEIPNKEQLITVYDGENRLLQLGIGGMTDSGKPCIFCKKYFSQSL